MTIMIMIMAIMIMLIMMIMIMIMMIMIMIMGDSGSPHVEPDDLLVLGIDLPTHLIICIMEKGKNDDDDNDKDGNDDDDDDNDKDGNNDDGEEQHLVEGGLKGGCSGLATAVHLNHFSISNQDDQLFNYSIVTTTLW